MFLILHKFEIISLKFYFSYQKNKCPNTEKFCPNDRQFSSFCQRSAGLTIVANVAIATGPALLADPRSFVLNLFLEFRCSRQTLGKTSLYFTPAIQLCRNFIR